MGWGLVILIWVGISIYFLRRPKKRPTQQILPDIKKDDVTVEDMVLHDMTNPDDVYDIGRINFNE